MPEVEIDAKQLQKVAVELSEIPKVAPKAMASALNRTIATVKTDMKREAVAAYEIKGADVMKTLRVRKASPSNLRAEASSIGQPVALIHFKVKPRNPPTKQTKKQLQVKIKKSAGFQTIKMKPSAFVQSVKGANNVFARTGKNRLPIKRLYSLSIPQMISNDGVIQKITEKANETLEKRVQHEIEYRLNKIKGGNK